ncbi:flocculation protein FLO11 [Clupea harengus]|uniref:Flocculation protein FLO11 n=1 Tax=Clupea harengus TaxID=7950 RepID=A0A6P8G3S6_CLUHA|nr:flocculation protein FLO11 [Clupea harengus]
MQSSPRKWVLKPLSPRLELSDLRSMVSPFSGDLLSSPPERSWGGQPEGQLDSLDFTSISVSRTQASVTVSTKLGEGTEDVVVQCRQVAVAETTGSGDSREGDAWSAGGSSTPSTPTTPGSPNSTGSHSGFYSFVEDPASLEAEQNEEWMVSPQRLAKLATLKRESSFKLQTYAPDMRPEKLFEESNGDSRYRVESTVAMAAEEEESDVGKLDRKEIIRDQAPKKSQVFKEQWSALESLDLSSPPRRLVEGFSICYGPMNPAAEPTPLEPGSIDEEQIDFTKARKQFLMMEQSRHSPVIQRPPDTPHSPAQPYASQVPAQLHRIPEVSSAASKDVPKDRSKTEHPGQSQTPPFGFSDDVFISNMVTVTVTEDGKALKGSSTTEWDSGRGDRLGGDASDGSVSNEPSRGESTASPLPAISQETPAEREVPNAQETPIEREIRNAQEREESLRQARGIRHNSTQEMVEIKTKPVLTQPTPPALARPVKAKDTHRVSFLIQREIERENRRDEGASVQGVGKGRGIYDVEERRRVFEPQVKSSSSSPAPSVSSEVSPTRLDTSQSPPSSREDSWTTEQPVFVKTSEQSETEEGLSPCCPHRHAEYTVPPVSRVRSASSSENSWGSRSRESTAGVTSRPAMEEWWNTSTDTQCVSSPTSILQKPFIKAETSSRFRAFSSSSLSSHTDGQDKEGRSLPPWKKHLEQRLQNAPDLIRQEIERDRQREQEHLVLRESRSLSVSLEKGLDDVDGSEQVVTITTPTNTAEQSDPKQSSEEENTTEQPSVTETREPPKKTIPPKEPIPPEEPIKSMSSRPSYSWSVDTYPMRRVSTADKTFNTPSPRPYSRLPSVSIVTAQPWGNQKPSFPVAPRVSPLVTSPAWVERGVRSMEGLGGASVITPTSAPAYASAITPTPASAYASAIIPTSASAYASAITPTPASAPASAPTSTPASAIMPTSASAYASSAYAYASDSAITPTPASASTPTPTSTPAYACASDSASIFAPTSFAPGPTSAPASASTHTQKGLTETLLEDFEERRAKLRLEDSAYAGIQPIDDVNNEVLEATRVTRHKNTRALRWEAGMYANEDAN